jgi:hypothetical protein
MTGFKMAPTLADQAAKARRERHNPKSVSPKADPETFDFPKRFICRQHIPNAIDDLLVGIRVEF